MDSWDEYARALKKLLRRPQLAEELKAMDTSTAARAELGVSEPMAKSLRDILLLLPVGTAPGQSDQGPFQKTNESVDFALSMLKSSSGHVRRTVALTTAMSVVMFVIGSALLIVAVIRALGGSTGFGTTAAIAGVGVVQIVALFYRNPLRDIADASATAQRTNVAVMSYVLGIGLIGFSAYGGRQTAGEFARLVELTEHTIGGLGSTARPAEDRRDSRSSASES